MNFLRERRRGLALLLALTTSALLATVAGPGPGGPSGLLLAGLVLAMLIAVAYG